MDKRMNDNILRNAYINTKQVGEKMLTKDFTILLLHFVVKDFHTKVSSVKMITVNNWLEKEKHSPFT